MKNIEELLNAHSKSGGNLLYDNDEESERFSKSALKYIKSKNGEELINEVSRRVEQNEISGIEFIYELFYEITKVDRFEHFLSMNSKEDFKPPK